MVRIHIPVRHCQLIYIQLFAWLLSFIGLPVISWFCSERCAYQLSYRACAQAILFGLSILYRLILRAVDTLRKRYFFFPFGPAFLPSKGQTLADLWHRGSAYEETCTRAGWYWTWAPFCSVRWWPQLSYLLSSSYSMRINSSDFSRLCEPARGQDRWKREPEKFSNSSILYTVIYTYKLYR